MVPAAAPHIPAAYSKPRLETRDVGTQAEDDDGGVRMEVTYQPRGPGQPHRSSGSRESR